MRCFYRVSVVLVLVILVNSLTAVPTQAAHSVFKRVLQRRYELASVSCNTCHVEEKERTERNEVGDVIYEQLADQKISERFREAKRRGFESRRQFEGVMEREFLQALKTIEPLRTSNGRTFGQRFRSADFRGLRLR